MLLFLVAYQYACRDAFVDYWVNGNMLTKDIATQIFTILKQPDLKYLTQVFFTFHNFILLPFDVYEELRSHIFIIMVLCELFLWHSSGGSAIRRD